MVLVPDREKLKTCLFVSTEYTNVTDRRTDGHTDRQTDTERRHKPRLHIASRGKNDIGTDEIVAMQ